MTVETLLQNLTKLKKTGQNKWQSCCPAHEDKTPSLAIKELDDGRVLIHCFAGCTSSEILQAIGLDFDTLYPTPASYHLPKARKPFNASDVLNALAFEVLIVWNCAKAISSGQTLTDVDQDRLMLSTTRLQRGLDVING
jgi:hypothetical protein